MRMQMTFEFYVKTYLKSKTLYLLLTTGQKLIKFN
jgi:hypothetical protein